MPDPDRRFSMWLKTNVVSVWKNHTCTASKKGAPFVWWADSGTHFKTLNEDKSGAHMCHPDRRCGEGQGGGGFRGGALAPGLLLIDQLRYLTVDWTSSHCSTQGLLQEEISRCRCAYRQGSWSALSPKISSHHPHRLSVRDAPDLLIYGSAPLITSLHCSLVLNCYSHSPHGAIWNFNQNCV